MLRRAVVFLFIFVIVSATPAELPLKVRADQALSQLQLNLQYNNNKEALQWLEKTLALESEGFTLPSGMKFFAGQVYVRNNLNEKAIPYLEDYLSQDPPGKNFWEAVQLLAQASAIKGKAFLEAYLAKENPPYYQQALALYTAIEHRAAREEKKLAIDADDRKPASERMGVLIDSRDQKRYKTVRIHGNVWMAENLNFISNNSWCYNNSNSNCARYGRLYNSNDALEVCPKGWHLGDADLLNGNEFATQWESGDFVSTDWGGRDLSGFGAIHGGAMASDDGHFAWNTSSEKRAFFWTYSRGWKRLNILSFANINGIFNMQTRLAGNSYLSSPSDGFSVRCIQD